MIAGAQNFGGPQFKFWKFSDPNGFLCYIYTAQFGGGEQCPADKNFEGELHPPVWDMKKRKKFGRGHGRWPRP